MVPHKDSRQVLCGNKDIHRVVRDEHQLAGIKTMHFANIFKHITVIHQV